MARNREPLAVLCGPFVRRGVTSWALLPTTKEDPRVLSGWLQLSCWGAGVVLRSQVFPIQLEVVEVRR